MTFRNAIDIIIRFTKDTYSSTLSQEEAKTIKSVMEAFDKDKEDYKAVREVDDIAIGRYDQAQKQGNSIKMQ